MLVNYYSYLFLLLMLVYFIVLVLVLDSCGVLFVMCGCWS